MAQDLWQRKGCQYAKTLTLNFGGGSPQVLCLGLRNILSLFPIRHSDTYIVYSSQKSSTNISLVIDPSNALSIRARIF